MIHLLLSSKAPEKTLDAAEIVSKLNTQFDVWVNNQIHNNEFLIAGLVTVAFGALIALLRNVPAQIGSFIMRVCTTVLTINTDHEMYSEVSEYIFHKRIKPFQRNIMLQPNYKQYYSGDEEEDRTACRWKFGPGYGRIFLWTNGVLVIGNKKMNESDSDRFKETVSLRFFTRKMSKIEKFVGDIRLNFEKDEEHIKIYHYRPHGWSELFKKPLRSMDSVFICSKIKKEVTDKIDNFLTKGREQWHLQTGIPYKLGICLYGEPGCGKSSLIHALASRYNRDIRILNLNSINESQLIEAFSWTKDSIIVIEDIDSHSVDTNDRVQTKSDPLKEKLTLSSLLNVFEGLLTPHGSFYVITTNHLKKIDKALLRKGRIDIKMKLGKMNRACLIDMYAAFYGEQHRRLLEGSLHTHHPISGADAQDIFMNNGPENAVKILHKVVS